MMIAGKLGHSKPTSAKVLAKKRFYNIEGSSFATPHSIMLSFQVLAWSAGSIGRSHIEAVGTGQHKEAWFHNNRFIAQ
jgi:hypothetical protein